MPARVDRGRPVQDDRRLEVAPAQAMQDRLLAAHRSGLNWHHQAVAVKGFASPEEAALASWQGTPAANARVRSVTVRGARAEVVVETDQSNRGYLDYVYCIQGEAGRWREVVSGNGPTVRWDDPDEYTWSY
jgi:hypothetical protein